MSDPLALLARHDKALLAAGDGVAFAPRDQIAAIPGFWTGAIVLGRPVFPLFTVTVLDGAGRELVPRVAVRSWTPAELIVEYRFAMGVQATEVRTVHPGGVFVSEWRLTSMTPAELHLVAWTSVDGADMRRGSQQFDGSLVCVRDGAAVGSQIGGAAEAMTCALAVAGGATSWATAASEGVVRDPAWHLTPFAERWAPAGLANALGADAPAGGGGSWFAAIHRAATVGSDGVAVAFAMRVVPLDASRRPPGAGAPAAPASGTFEGASRRRWDARFAELPQVSSTDPYLERTYWYRWFGAWALRVERGTGAFLSGGTSGHARSFGVADATMVPAHVRDLRWHPDASWARAALFQFLDHQRENGSLPRTVNLSGPSADNAPATVDWGGALLALAEVELDAATLESAWRALDRYGRWLSATHDRRESGLIDLGLPRELDGAVSPRFTGRRLKGVDTTAVAYRLFAVLADLAPRVGGDAEFWRARAARTARAVRERLWDDELGLFCDLEIATGERIRVRTSAGFTPFAMGLAWPEIVPRVVETLLDVRRFWTPFPVPSLAADDPHFSALGESDGVRVARPRNGRTWPGDTAMMIDALAAAEPDGGGPLRRAAAQLLKRLVRVHFPDGDLHAPSAHEHVNPFTGHPSAHRGVDEYFAAWMVDLLVRHVAGVRPSPHGVRLDPLPLGVDAFSLTGLRVRRRRIDVAVNRETARATLDGIELAAKIGEPTAELVDERREARASNPVLSPLDV